MSTLTISEALAEVKTIDARLAKKQQFIGEHLFRQDRMRDPLEKDGGARAVIAQERQSMADLQERKLALRRAIGVANTETQVTVGGVMRSIADWLVWRREVAPTKKQILDGLASGIKQARQQAQQKGLAVVSTSDVATSPNDLIINVDERALAAEIEGLEEVLGKLDGQLSLKNATTVVEI